MDILQTIYKLGDNGCKQTHLDRVFQSNGDKISDLSTLMFTQLLHEAIILYFRPETISIVFAACITNANITFCLC